MDSQAQVRLVFAGEVLDGFAVDDVKRRFGEAFKLDDAKVAPMFSGGRTVLKRAIGRDDGERYVAKLRTLGMRVLVEPLEAPAAPAAVPTPVSAPVAAPAASLAPVAAAAAASLPPAPAPIAALPPLEEEVVCPNCGERQSKRVLCRKCQTDIPRALASKQEELDRALAERQAAREAARSGGRYAPPKAELGVEHEGGDELVEPPRILSLSFQGRMGRVSYLNSGLVAMVLMAAVGILAAVVLPLTRSVLLLVPMGVLFVAFMVWAIRLGALRLHDLNRSGWWVVILAIPYLGSVASLVMMLWPGTKGDNDYGAQPRMGNAMVAIASVVLSIVIGVAAFTYADRFEKQAKAQTQERQASRDAAPSDAAKAQALLRSPAAVAAYEQHYAGEATHKAFAVSSSGAWGWVAGKSSQRDAIRQALARCEELRQPYTAECTVVNVNGGWADDRDN